MDRLVEALRTFTEHDKTQRQGAEDYVAGLLTQNPAETVVALLEIGTGDTTNSVPQAVAFQGVVRVKRYFNDFCQQLDHVANVLPQMKDICLARLTSLEPLRRRQLLEVIIIINSKSKWPELFVAVTSVLKKEVCEANQNEHEAALEITERLVSHYKEKHTWKASTVGSYEEASSTVLPLLSPLFAYNKLSMSHLCLEIFQSFTANNTPRVLVNDSGLFDSWMQFLLGFPQAFESLTSRKISSPAEAEEYKKYVDCITSIGSISLTFIQEARANKSGLKRMARYFVKTHATNFGNFWLSWLRFAKDKCGDAEDTQLHMETTRRAITFLEECTNNKKMYNAVIQDNAAELIVNLLFEPYMAITAEEQELFINDPEQYLTEQKFVGAKDLTIRGAALYCIRKLVKPTEDFHDTSLMAQLLSYLGNKLREADSPLTEGAYTLIIALRKHLMDEKAPWWQQLEQLMGQAVIPRMGSEHPFIRAKACEMCGKFSKIPLSDQNYKDTIRFLFTCMQDSNIVVCISAATALTPFIGSRRATQHILPNLRNILEGIFWLIPRTHSEFLVICLRLITERFTQELCGLNMVQRVVKELTKHCLRALFENNAKSGEAEDMDVDPDDVNFQADMFAMDSYVVSILSCCSALKSIFSHLAYAPQVAYDLQPELLHLFTELLKNDDESILSEAAEPIADCIGASLGAGLHPSMWNLFPLMCELILIPGGEDGEAMVNCMMFENYARAMENIITLDPQGFLNSQENMQLFVKVCRGVLNESDRVASGEAAQCPQLISSTLQFMKQANGAFDQCAQALFSVCMSTLQSTQDPVLQLLLTSTSMDFFYYNPNMFVGQLVNMNVLMDFMRKFLEFFETAKNDSQIKYDCMERKVIILGLSSMMECLLNNNSGNLNEEQLQLFEASVKAAVWCVERNCTTYQLFMNKVAESKGDRDLDPDEVDYDELGSVATSNDDDSYLGEDCSIKAYDEDDFGDDHLDVEDDNEGGGFTVGGADDPDGFIATDKKAANDGNTGTALDDYDDSLDTPLNNVCEITTLGSFLKGAFSERVPSLAQKFFGGSSTLENDLLNARELAQNVRDKDAHLREEYKNQFLRRAEAISNVTQDEGIERTQE